MLISWSHLGKHDSENQIIFGHLACWNGFLIWTVGHKKRPKQSSPLPRAGLGHLLSAGFLGEARSGISCRNQPEVLLFWFIFNLGSGWDAQAPAVPWVGAVTIIPLSRLEQKVQPGSEIVFIREISQVSHHQFQLQQKALYQKILSWSCLE